MSALTVPRLARPAKALAETVPPGLLRSPPLRPGVIDRSRLTRRLDELASAPLTVVAAPTGYGKTTLLASWAGSTPRRVAWASVRSRDLDVDGFWTLLAAALKHVEPRLCFELPAGPRAERSVQMAVALAPLSHELTLVVDGYEQATRVGLDPAFGRFLDLAPEELHVLVSTRSEPELALPLRRVRGIVAELGAGDLAFDEDEAAAVVRRTSGISPTDVDIADLSERTEGWPAAVYLAALVARAAPRPADRLARFSGAEREISDYLRLELLEAQPDDALRSFLLDTSVLERLTAPLCDALLGRQDSESTLRALVRGGAFLVPLEGTHEYVYVRPVGEFLRAELARVASERVGHLHRRAAIACERAGLFDEAARHAHAATGEEEAESLLGRHALELVRDGRTEHLEAVLATPAGAAAEHRRPTLRAELRCLARGGSDVAALSKAAERVSILSAGLAHGPVRALLETTARAAQAYALLLSGSVAEAYEAGAAAYAEADPDAAAQTAAAAAVASLAAARLGLGAVAAPLARASAAALVSRGIQSGDAAALASLADAAVAEELQDFSRAEQSSAEALERAKDAPLRALALLRLAHVRTATAGAARPVLEEARAELARCDGATLLETLAAELECELALRERSCVATGELSPAEQRVLRLLATRLTQREIANELFVSLNTVKTHTRQVYRKLGVDSRPAAVAAARDLNLV